MLITILSLSIFCCATWYYLNQPEEQSVVDFDDQEHNQ